MDTITTISRDELRRAIDELGYTNVVEYVGGKQDWIDAGLPTERGITQESESDADTERHKHDSGRVDEASDESFPASDSPGCRP